MPDELIKRFCEETLDQIREISADIVRSEKEAIPDSLFEGILRTLHSIKGSSRMLGLSRFAETVHSAEDLFAIVADKPEHITPDLIDSLLATIDQLEYSLDALYQDAEEPNYSEIIESIETVYGKLRNGHAAGLEVIAKSEPEIFHSLTPQQSELLLESIKEFEHLYVLDLTFNRTSFSKDVRSVHALLKNAGKLIATTGTTSSTAIGNDLKFLFLELSNSGSEEFLGLFSSYAPSLREIPLEGTSETSSPPALTTTSESIVENSVVEEAELSTPPSSGITRAVDVHLLERYVPEIHDVLAQQQIQLLENHYEEFNHLYVLGLSFSRSSFSSDVRSINKLLSAEGKLISTTGTVKAPAENFELMFLFLILTNADKARIIELTKSHAPTVTELPSLLVREDGSEEVVDYEPQSPESGLEQTAANIDETVELQSALSYSQDDSIADYEEHAPELFQVLGSQQIDAFLTGVPRYEHIYIVDMSFEREKFTEKVRDVTALLSSKGQLISTTGTAQSAPEGYDLRFIFLFLSNEPAPQLVKAFRDFAVDVREIPKAGALAASVEAASPKVETPESDISISVSTESPVKQSAPVVREIRKGSPLETERRDVLKLFTDQAPDILSVLTPQQEDTLLSQYSRYEHVFLLELSFMRKNFSNDIRMISGQLSRNGLLLSSTGTGNEPALHFDLRFAFLFLTNLPEVTIQEFTSDYAPVLKEIHGPASEAALVEDITTAEFPIEISEETQDETPAEEDSLHYGDDFVKLQEWFLDEGEEILKTLGTDIVSLEKEGDPELIHAIFRSFHNLKGSGGSYNFSNVSRIAHVMESFVQPFRSSVDPPDSVAIDKMLRGVDMLSQIFQECKDGKHDLIEVTKLEDELRAILKDELKEQVADLTEQKAGADTEVQIEEEQVPSPVPSQERHVAPDEILPPVPKVEPLHMEPKVEAAKQTKRDRPASSKAPDSIRVNLRKLDSIVYTAVELSVAHASEQRVLIDLNEAFEEHGRLIGEWKVIEEKLRQEHSSRSEKVHSMTDLHSKTLSIFQQRLRDIYAKIESNSYRRSTLASELGDEALQLQLQPLSTLFDSFQRIVRDLSKSLEKPTDLVLEDQYVEVDRRIIEALKDPFTHILRNAIDHGIERPETRRANFKPERGKITVSAKQMGFSFVINVSDDGCGIDKESLGKAVLARGLTTRDELESMHEADLYSFLFKPGFSTQSKVTDISGRGVGLDVVETNVRQLGGEVQIYSELGKGTTFAIHLPTNLTLSRALLLQVHNQIFSFPVATTERVLALPPSAVETRNGTPLVAYEDNYIPVVEIEQVLGVTRSTLRMRNGLVIKKRDTLICLSVPRILDETELITKPMPPHLRGNRLVSGVNVLSDGTLALVLNPSALSASVMTSSAESEAERRPKKRLLVVDDSLIARELLSNILLAFDYEVSLARDGKEALQFLKMHVVDLIISDVDMPNMNGYALAKFIKSDKELQQIPIIIITAKESNRDRMEGLEIGADEYLYKGSFNQQNLIDTVEQLLEKTKP